MTKLLDKLDEEKLFDPPLPSGVIYPDGPSYTVHATRGKKQIRLTHDGSYNAPQNIGEHAAPFREQVEAFCTMWAHMCTQFGELALPQLNIYEGPVTWSLPKP